MLYLGKPMVPVPGYCSGAIPRTIISTASDQQSLGTAVSCIAGGTTDSRQTGLRLSSTLTPQMTNLKISNTSVQIQKPVDVEKSARTNIQSSWTVEGRRDSLQVPPVITAAQSETCLPAEVARTLQHHVGIMSTAQSNQSFAWKNYSGLSQGMEKTTDMNNAATEGHHELPEISTYDLDEILVSAVNLGIINYLITNSTWINGFLDSEEDLHPVFKTFVTVNKSTCSSFQDFSHRGRVFQHEHYVSSSSSHKSRSNILFLWIKKYLFAGAFACLFAS